jgi:6-phosphogluconolactonase (cycloisomerase 2 family)
VAVVDPTTQFLNVADVGVGSLGGISSYTISSNGALTAGASGALVLLLNTGVADIAIHRSGKFLYASTGILAGDSGVMLITVDQNSGALTQVGSTPFSTGLAPQKITMHPLGMFLYTANIGDGTISGFKIDNSSGTLTPVSGSPFRIFAAPPPGGLIFFDMAIDPSGGFLYADDPLTSNILGFRVDSLTGSLTPVAQTPRTPSGISSFTIVRLP